uniref:Egg-white cystatin n=1 Tax=Melopsittacus undulatus TaxID=13146 RepID=A0A8C6JMZ7_MELUD
MPAPVLLSAWVCVSLLAVALVLVGSVRIGDELDPVLGAPKDIDNPDNDEGVQKALKFAMTEYNKASNDLYASRVVRIISAKSQIVSGVKYIMKVEVGQTTCPKTATDLQSCALHEEPDMAKVSSRAGPQVSNRVPPSAAANKPVLFQQRPATRCSDLRNKIKAITQVEMGFIHAC